MLAPLAVEVEQHLASAPTSGISIGVSYGGESWARGFGYADVRKKRKATKRTSYRMASVTKMFTGVLVMQQVERKRMKLDEDVRTYVPTFPEKRWPISVRHLLGHLGGVSHYRDYAAETHFTRPYTTAEALAVFQDWKLLDKPGQRYVYTSYGFNLLGAAVEGVTGLTYGQALQKGIFRRARMKDSMVEDPSKRNRRWATGYKVVGGKLRKSELVDISSRFAGGGTRSTVVDMLKFGRALMAGKLVRARTLATMQQSMADGEGKLTDYGLGMAAYPSGGRWLLCHAGSQPETSTLLCVLPAEGLVIAIAQNLEDQWHVNSRLQNRVLDLVLAGGERRRGLQGRALDRHLMAQGVLRLYSHGLGLYRLRGKRLDEGTGHLLRAFSETERILDPEALAADPVLGWETIQLGLGPNTERALPVVGSFMAATLASVHGPAHLERYNAAGTLAFVRDYVDTCEKIDCPDGLRLPSSVVALVDEGTDSFEAAYPPGLRRWVPTVEEGPEAARTKLADAFGEAPLVPDFTAELRGHGEEALRKGDLDQASAWLEMASELYPHDARVTLQLAYSKYAGEMRDAADALMTRVTQLPGAKKRLKPARLKFAAWHLKRAGFDAGSRDLIFFAARHHDEDASLWDLLAKKSEASDDKELALTALRRAEELDPKKRRRARITALEAAIGKSEEPETATGGQAEPSGDP